MRFFTLLYVLSGVLVNANVVAKVKVPASFIDFTLFRTRTLTTLLRKLEEQSHLRTTITKCNEEYVLSFHSLKYDERMNSIVHDPKAHECTVCWQNHNDSRFCKSCTQPLCDKCFKEIEKSKKLFHGCPICRKPFKKNKVWGVSINDWKQEIIRKRQEYFYEVCLFFTSNYDAFTVKDYSGELYENKCPKRVIMDI